MKTFNQKVIMVLTLAFVLGMSILTGCQKDMASLTASQLASGGVLVLKVNPEIAVHYDAQGRVTKVSGRNEDGRKILKDYTGFEGRACRDVIVDLVAAIGKAGYFIEEVEGKNRQIRIEIEKGSGMPNQTFINEVIASVRDYVKKNQWNSSIEIEREDDDPMPEYKDTDYGPDNDGVTDYQDTDYGPGSDGVTDYRDKDTDYGPDNDGVTDYQDTDYGPGSDGVTNYEVKDTDYGPDNDGITNYDADDVDEDQDDDGHDD